jgi:hypothetical protein
VVSHFTDGNTESPKGQAMTFPMPELVAG